MGGEKWRYCCAALAVLGSPPRGRGKVGAALLHPLAVGITPAWAGKSLGLVRVTLRDRDHPRIGGEKAYRQTVPGLGLGSPPRRRGKGQALLADDFGVGSTPAQAGKSSARFPHRTSARDHPRIGGEKQCSLFEVCAQEGSPLRRRGKARFRVGREMAVGITPAQAGKR